MPKWEVWPSELPRLPRITSLQIAVFNSFVCRYLMLAAEDGLVNRDDFRFLQYGLEQHYAMMKTKSRYDSVV